MPICRCQSNLAVFSAKSQRYARLAGALAHTCPGGGRRVWHVSSAEMLLVEKISRANTKLESTCLPQDILYRPCVSLHMQRWSFAFNNWRGKKIIHINYILSFWNIEKITKGLQKLDSTSSSQFLFVIDYKNFFSCHLQQQQQSTTRTQTRNKQVLFYKDVTFMYITISTLYIK